MDQTIVDITEVPSAVRCGDPVVLIGRQDGAEIPLTEFSTWSDTIPYEIVCGISARVPRRIVTT